MGVTITYNGSTIASVEPGQSKTAKTGGKYVAHDLVVHYETDAAATPGNYEEKPQASYSGSMASDALGSIAVYLGWKPASVTLAASISGGSKTSVTFPNLSGLASGTLLGIWEGSTTVYQGRSAFYAGFNGASGSRRRYYTIVLQDYGFSAQMGITNSSWSDCDDLAEGSTVEWSAAVNTSQTRTVPGVSAGFIRAEGNRLKDAAGNNWVCRSMNARLNLLLGSSETEEQRQATWELSQAVYDELAGLGFNTIKLLWSAHFFETEANPYNYRSAAWTWLNQNITWAKNAGLKIMLNCHRGQGGAQYSGDGVAYWTNRENQKRLHALWKEIARRYRNEPTIVGYGIFNEPWVDDSGNDGFTGVLHHKFSAATQEIIDAIRSVDTNHVIFADMALGVYNATSTYTGILHRSYWQVPMVRDHNLCLEWHDYYPHNFSVQNPNVSGKTLEYPGTLYSTGGPTTDAAWQRGFMTAVAQKFYNLFRREVPLFIGEWGGGGIQKADSDSTLRGMFVQFFTDKMAAYNALGYGYSWHLWTGVSMGYYPTNPTASYTSNGKRSWLTSVFQTGNRTAQSGTQTGQTGSQGTVEIPTTPQNTLVAASTSDTALSIKFSVSAEPENMVLLSLNPPAANSFREYFKVGSNYMYIVHSASTTNANVSTQGNTVSYSYENGTLTFRTGSSYPFKKGSYRLLWW